MELDAYKKIFFSLLKAGLFPANDGGFMINESFFCEVDWSKVYQLAQEQAVQGLALQGLEKLRDKDLELSVPQTLLLQWIGEVQIIEQRNKEMNTFIADLIEKLRKHDIYALLVKGQGVAQCYEKPLWRSSGDVDLFLNDENYKKAKDYLTPLASSVEKEVEATLHLGMTIDGWVVELHGKLNGYLSSKVITLLSIIQRDSFYGGNVRTWMNGKTQVFLLKEENEILYGFVHFLNHFYKEGVGLRQLCDWCRLLYTYKNSLNYELLEQRIKRAGLVSEWRAFGALAIEYLGYPKQYMPLLNSSNVQEFKFKRKADRLMQFVLEVGNLGHNRDASYMKYPFLIRKCFSMGRRIQDLCRHFMIFPLDSLMFFPYIMFNGIRSAIRGEG